MLWVEIRIDIYVDAVGQLCYRCVFLLNGCVLNEMRYLGNGRIIEFREM